MSRATGCISLAVEHTDQVQVERVIETVCPRMSRRTCELWADIFIHNPTSDSHDVLLLHRGKPACAQTSRRHGNLLNPAGMKPSLP